MASGTDEPLSVGSDEPHFSMQFDINLNYKLYEYVSEVTSGRYVGPRPGAIPNTESESKEESESESGFDSGFGFMCSGIGFGVGIVYI